jgi:sterol desaturase/sphingolipid hydroxylase (fatty acid hydroxylase superfamily)
METYGYVLNIAMPIFIGLFLVEKIVEWRMGRQVIRGLDSVSSLSSGITNVTKDVLGIGIGIIAYSWLVDKVALVRIENTVLTYAIAFIVMDFHGYWSHRLSHEINFLWNRHIIHHSSEEFNLSCALRQSVSGFVNYFTILLLPAALLGVPEQVIAVIAPLHLFLQYWYHTRLIGKMGFLEKIIVTPSHHRVHHAINKEYLDKNHSQIFIIWDKLFGTFQEELDDVPPVYGVTRPVRTWNPIRINFQHFWLLLTDAWHARSWWDKVRIWFMPTGWRPADVAEKYPVYGIKDPYNFEKYDTPASKAFIAWAWVQMFFCYFLLVYFFAYIARIGSPNIFAYGAFVFLCVFAYTELTDRRKYAMYIEIAKSAVGLWIVYYLGDWFGASQTAVPWFTWVVVGYLILSAGVASWFAIVEIGKNEVSGTADMLMARG